MSDAWEDEGYTIRGQWMPGRGFLVHHEDLPWVETNLPPFTHCLLTVAKRRSMKSHRHLFPWLRDAWDSLPERFSDQSWAASPEHLRKYALIRTGFYDVSEIPVESREEAIRWTAMMRTIDTYAVVIPGDTAVSYYTAQSQKLSAMGAKRFQESKTAVLGFVAELLGVEPEALDRQGRKKEKTNVGRKRDHRHAGDDAEACG